MGHRGKIMGATFIGMTAGALAGLLMAPKKGEDLRGDIKGRATDAKDKAKDTANDFYERIGNGWKAAKGKVKEVKDETERNRPRRNT